MQVEPGTVVDRYIFECLIGTGGMASVYLATHTSLGSRHAIKVLTVPTPAVQERLLQEGRAQSRVAHPNIVTVTDVVDVSGSPGLVMEYVHGPTLRQLLLHERLEIDQADRLVRGVLRGVAAAHRAQLVHRDLKPGNILLAPADGGLLPKITDFGLAKVLRPGHGGPFRTRSGLPMGTPSFMAPEQIRDAAGVDERADIWALGAILYEMVTGARAFLGTDVVDTYQRVSEGSYVAPRELAPRLPRRMVDAIDGCLRVDPAQRFSDVASLLETWRGGVDVSDAATLDPSLLERARALVSVPEPSGAPTTSNWTGASNSEETWADPDLVSLASHSLHAPTTTASVAHAAGSGTPKVRRVLAALGGLALVAVGAWLVQESQQDAAEVVFAANEIPAVFEDAGKQDALEAAWFAMLDVDFEEADRRLQVVLDRDPAALAPLLVRARTLQYSSRHGESLDTFWSAVRHAEEEEGPIAELARVAGRVRSASWEERGHEALKHLEAHPSDLLAHLVVLGLVPATERGTTDALFDSMDDLAEGAALTAWLRAERHLLHEEFDRAERVLRDGLDMSPRTPTLLASLGDVLLHRGRPEDARAALVDALEIAPGDALARTRLAAAWLMLGRDADVQRTTEQMTASPTLWAHQARYASYMAGIYGGLGRFDEAVALLRRGAEAAVERAEWTTALTLYGQVPMLYMDAEMVLPMIEGAHALTELSHQPEIPDAEREMLVRNLLYARAVGDVRTGKLEAAEQSLARLRELDRVWPIYIEWLQRELAIARGESDRVARLFHSIPEGCVGDLEKASALYRSGDRTRLLPLLDDRLGHPEQCSQVGTPRFLQAAAHVNRAELAHEAGDSALAGRHLDAFEAAWPSPDRDIPAVERARSLRIRMR